MLNNITFQNYFVRIHCHLKNKFKLINKCMIATPNDIPEIYLQYSTNYPMI